MNLKLVRIARKPKYTIGKLYVDDVHFCDTIEDPDRGLSQTMPLADIAKKKVKHQTAIPTGVYDVIVNMSQAKGRKLPRLLNVPGFDGILIHRGNSADDSSGCIIVGLNKSVGTVSSSTFYENKLVALLLDETDVKITIE